jgi:hypothetical protein
MKKVLLTLAACAAFFGFANAGEIVIMDPATLTGGLADSVVDIGGTKYLKVTVNEWNTYLTIPEVEIPANVTKIQFKSKYDPGSSGYTVAQSNIFVKVVSSDWAKTLLATNTPSSADIKDYELAAAGGLTSGVLQLAAQETSGWNPVKGGIFYIGKITGISTDLVIAEPPVTYNVSKTATAIEIDALEDDAMANVAKAEIKNVALGTVASTADNSGFFKAMYDDKNLYLYVEVTDDDPIAYGDATQPWNNDGIEIFVDAKDRRYVGGARISSEQHQLRINLDRYYTGTEILSMDQSGLGTTDTMTAATYKDNAAYYIEAAIPWKGICTATDVDATKIGDGFKMCFEISVLDASAKDTRKSILNWANNTGTDVAYASNQYYGRLVLGSGSTSVGSVSKVSDIAYSRASNLLKFASASSVNVYDITGKLVIKAANVSSVSTSSLNNGVYVVVAGNERLKFIK